MDFSSCFFALDSRYHKLWTIQIFSPVVDHQPHLHYVKARVVRPKVFPQHWVFYFYVSASEQFCPSVLAIFFVKCPICNLFLLKPKPNIYNWGGQAGKVPLASGPGIPWRRQFSIVIDGPQYGWRSYNGSCFSVWESRGWSRIIKLGKYIENSSCDVCLWFLDSFVGFVADTWQPGQGLIRNHYWMYRPLDISPKIGISCKSVLWVKWFW